MTSQNKKMGRPKKNEVDKQTERVFTRLTKSEDLQYKEYCENKNTTVSQDLRNYILSQIKK